MQDNYNLEKEKKESFLQKLYRSLKTHTKHSLQYKKKHIQESILQTLSNLSHIRNETLILHIMDLALYFIMIPTSKHSLTAINIFVTIEIEHKTKLKILFAQFRKELCKTIVEMAALNQTLNNSTLYASLQKIATQFGYTSTKDFVVQECDYLLRFLVPLIATLPRIRELINELADMVGMEVAQMLLAKFKGIFLHLYLSETEQVCQQAMVYLEKETGSSGSTLRKNNFKVSSFYFYVFF